MFCEFDCELEVVYNSQFSYVVVVVSVSYVLSLLWFLLTYGKCIYDVGLFRL